jgi:hypothetical protein
MGRLLEKVHLRMGVLSETKSEEALTEAHYQAEFGGALERGLAYIFTGATHSFVRKLMDRLFITRGLMSGGLPCINSRIVDVSDADGDVGFLIRRESWPLLGDGEPMRSSMRACELTYGNELNSVSLVCFLPKPSDYRTPR